MVHLKLRLNILIPGHQGESEIEKNIDWNVLSLTVPVLLIGIHLIGAV